MSNLTPLPSIPVPDHEVSAYILSCLDAQKSILECEAYPDAWLSLNIHHHRSTLRGLENISRLLTKGFLPPPDFAERFDMELWKAFFMTLLRLVGSDALALETFPEQKRRAVWKIAGDVRESGADLLRRTWKTIGWEANPDDQRRYSLKKIGGYQVQYVPSLVSPIVELCLSVHQGVRRVAVEILQTMIVSEWALSEELGLIETEIIASLDVIFKTKSINESSTQKLFIEELLDLFEPIANQPDDALWVALKEFVTTIDELMDLLVAAQGDSMESTLHTLRLMDFMKDMQKDDIYVRYVHDLARVQQDSRNSTEAGLALQLHADLYPWDLNKTVPAIPSPLFPEQSAFERKEALYFQIIQHFEDGRAWSHALACYRELASYYEHAIFDFTKLARTQRSMSNITDAIAKEERHSPRYFKVTYRGLGFPTSVRDKQYIFEGSPSERMAAFTDRMQKLHPAAQVTQSSDATNLEGQYLEVSSVSIHRNFNHPVYQRARLQPSVKEYLLNSNPIQFSVSSKRHVPGTHVREQWVEKRIYTTAEPFPTILRRSEIVSSEEVRLSPIETAIERTWRKTAELLVLEKRAISGEDPNNSTLGAALLQLLDTDSSSGTCLAQYRQLLPERQQKVEETPPKPDDQSDLTATDDVEDSDSSGISLNPLETALYISLSDHASAIKRCLLLYNRPSLQATRKDLNERFDIIYPEEARLPTPQLDQQEHSGHERSPSIGSDVQRPNGDLPHSRDDKTSMDTMKQRAIDGGRVRSPDLSESSRMSRQARPHRLSLQMITGAATSLLQDKKESHTARPQTPRQEERWIPVSPAKSQSNGVLATEASGATKVPDEDSGRSTVAQDKPEPSSPGTSYAQHHGQNDAVNRESLYSSSMASENANIPVLEPNDHFRETLKQGLGASISSSRFAVPEDKAISRVAGDEDGRPVTAESGATGSTGRKKRFSLMRLGKKKSGNSVTNSSIRSENRDGIAE